MRALVVDPQAPAALRLADVPEPAPGPNQAVIEVHHASVNYGELNGARSGQVPPGTVLGWDASGVVVEAAALPVAGVTALQALRAAGSVLGKRVLVGAGALRPAAHRQGRAQHRMSWRRR